MGGSPTKGGPLRWLMDLVLIGPRLGIMLLDTIPFDKIPLGTIPFDTMLLTTAKLHQVHDYLAIDTADVIHTCEAKGPCSQPPAISLA
ncbi:MAG: hypothetical protein ACRDDA_06815 [Aeromonas sp.]